MILKNGLKENFRILYSRSEDMKKLSELYPVDSDVFVKDIKINSKNVEPGDIFVCTMGVTADRHDFIDEAIENGAVAVIISKDVEEKRVPVIKVENTNQELINLARRFYGFQNDDLKLIGVTGTNGKTTIATMIQDLLGETCGYMGTNGLVSKSFQEKILNTTPDADRLFKYFSRFVKDGCTTLCMETSSESFFRKRMETLEFEVGIIASITEDHLNIHKTIENYVDCKMELLRKVKEDGFSILNTDDQYYELAKQNAKGTVLTYGKKKEATMRLLSVLEKVDGSIIYIEYNGKNYEIKSPFLGEVNAYNLMASLLTCITQNISIEELIQKTSFMKTVPGRLDPVIKRDYTVMLDYAHTTDAFKKILPILNRMKENSLVVVTGSAGGREHEKRGPMGAYILENSDHVIFTMDDPRYENVLNIIHDLTKDSDKKNYEIIIDRKEAIYKAIDNAKKGDIILIAGKGVDDYMAIDDKYLPYSDLEVIQEYNEEHGF